MDAEYINSNKYFLNTFYFFKVLNKLILCKDMPVKQLKIKLEMIANY